MEWVDGNLGSRVTMKYPSIYLLGERAHGEVLSIAFAGSDQHQDAGGKIIHAAPNTTSLITSKSISQGTGRTSYRGLIKVYPGCKKAKSTVRCDALILSEYVVYRERVYEVTGVGALLNRATFGTGSRSLLFFSLAALVITVVAFNRLVWDRLYRFVQARYRLEG